MDFRTCPACKSSVLEDDVEDCPFCGASMSGKQKPPQPKNAAAAKPVGKPTGASPAGIAKPTSANRTSGSKGAVPGKGQSVEKKEAASDDPFDVDTSVARDAIKVSPRQTKSRTMEVVCPMCETHGFITPADGGKDVHCTNTECMVPVFKAPRPVKVEVVVEQPKSKLPLIIGGGLAAILLFGAIYWNFIREEPVVEIVNDDPVPKNVDTDNLLPDQNVRIKVVEAKDATLQEIVTLSLSKIGTVVSSERQAAIKAECARLAAMSYAHAGQLADALPQLSLVESNRGSEFKQIAPLIEIAWQEIKENKVDAAKGHIDEALSHANSVQGENREALDSCAELGAILVHQGRTPEANQLLENRQITGIMGQLSTVWTTAVESGTFDVELETYRPYHTDMVEPLRVAIVEILTMRGHVQQALAFANASSNVATQDLCRAGWAGRLTDSSPTTVDAMVTQALTESNVSPTGQCRAWSAVAGHFAQANNSAQAKAAFEKAVAALKQIPEPAASTVPSMKEIHNSKGDPHAGLTDPMPARSAASAAADVSIVQFIMGDKTSAWKTLQTALKFANGMTPSPVATQELIDQNDKRSTTVKARLNSEFELEGNDAAITRHFGQYKTQCQQLNELANARLNLQANFLVRAVEQGLLDQAWGEVAAQANQTDKNQQIPYEQTRVPGLIRFLAIQQGNTALSDKIQADFAKKTINKDSVDQMYVDVLAKLTESGAANRTISDAVEAIYKYDKEQKTNKAAGRTAIPLTQEQTVRLDWIAFRLLSRRLQATEISESFELVSLQSDITLRQKGFQMVAGYSVHASTAPKLWKLVEASTSLQSTDLAALYYGFIQGSGANAASPAPVNVSSTAK